MRDSLFHVERRESLTLQAQIREALVSAMLAGQLPAGSAVPSTRVMAKRLKVSRNTVMLAYQALAADGYLLAREKSGFYVSADAARLSAPAGAPRAPAGASPDWGARLRMRPSAQRNITKPQDWRNYPFPFVYGQVDVDLFPMAAWRDCTRQAMSRRWLEDLSDDRFTVDDPMLVEQIRQRILSRRGILAGPDEILLTMGAQNALYLLAQLLAGPETPVALEDPGYADVRNIFALQTRALRFLPVDEDGLRTELLTDEQLVFVTPSHQAPTAVTMSLPRRRALLDWAAARDALVIEDDYEFEFNYHGEPTPALKSMDRQGRVIYVGSFSKSLMPGLRMGFMVAPPPLVEEARALRRLMLRHPPGNNQRVVALLLALGAHDALIGRLHRSFRARWSVLHEAMETHLPGWAMKSPFGGTAVWVRGPEGLDARELAREVQADGVLIETGDVHFADEALSGRPRPRNFFRLGFSSIPEERIAEGIARLAAGAGRVLERGAGAEVGR